MAVVGGGLRQVADDVAGLGQILTRLRVGEVVLEGRGDGLQWKALQQVEPVGDGFSDGRLVVEAPGLGDERGKGGFVSEQHGGIPPR